MADQGFTVAGVADFTLGRPNLRTTSWDSAVRYQGVDCFLRLAEPEQSSLAALDGY